MSKQEIRATRRELAKLTSDLDVFANRASSAGKRGGRGFSRHFKTAAKFGMKTLAASLIDRGVEAWFKRRGKKSGRDYSKNFKQSAKAEIDSGGGVGGMLGPLNLKTMAIVGAGALAALIVTQLKSGMESAMEKERFTISFDALSADGAGGDRIFENLRQQALRTGIEIKSMAKNVQQFLGLGFEESDALKLNDALLDIAGGLGMTSAEAAGLGTALAQVKSKGVASMEELRQQIAEKGVPVFQVLAEKMGITEAAVIKMVSAGKLGADVVIEAFQNLEGPLAKFRGGAARLGESGGGLFGRLKQHAMDLKRIFSNELLPELKPILKDALGFIQRMKGRAKELGSALAESLGYVRAMFTELSFTEVFELAGLKLKESLLTALNFAARGASALMSALSDDRFSVALEKAAFRFTQAMLRGVGEVLAEMEGIPGIGEDLAFAGRQMGELAKFKENESAVNPFLKNPTGPSIMDLIMEEFAKTPQLFGLSEGDAARAKVLADRVSKRRAEQVAAREGKTDKPDLSGGGSEPKKKPVFDPSALLGSGLSGALSKLAGGPGTIIMKEQLAVQQATQKNTAETASAVHDVVTELQNLSPRRGERSRGVAALL